MEQPCPEAVALPFLRGGGTMASLISTYDWADTPMGPLTQWPEHVRSVTALMLRSRVPIVMLWGQAGVMVYNDAYAVFAGARHPQLLGSPVRQGWPEVADFNDQVMRAGLAGETLHYEDQELVLHRNGRAEQVWMDLDYSPILDAQGEPAGVVAVVVETSSKVLAERRVQGERARLSQLFEQTPGFMAVVSGPDHRFEICNPAYQRLVGDRPLVGRTLREALPEAVEQGYGRILDEVYRSGKAYTASAAPFASLGDGGTMRQQYYLDFVYQPMYDEAGRVDRIFIEGVDVTERVRSDRRRELLLQLSERLRASRDPALMAAAATQLLRDHLALDRAGFAVATPAGGWRSLHDSGPQATTAWMGPAGGRARALLAAGALGDATGHPIAVADVCLDARTASFAAALQARQVRATVDMPLVEAGRPVAWLYVAQAAPRDWGTQDLELLREVAGHIWTAVDRAQREEAAYALDRQFRALVTASSDVVYSMDPDWQRMRSLHGGDFVVSSDAPSRSWLQTYIPAAEQARVQRAIDEAVRTSTVFELEHRVLRPDGSVGWTFSRAIPITDRTGRVVEWFGAASDVTHRKQVEQDLLESEERLRHADRRKDEFLATLAHELRNPLAPIRNAVQLLGTLDPGGQFGKIRHLLERQVNHMVRLVDDLLEVSRIHRGVITLRQEALNLKDIVSAAVESSQPLIDRGCHQLTLQFDGPAPWVQGDTVRLTQVLVNLLNNAARYTDDGGRIRVAVRQTGEHAVVEVQDSGIGIVPDQLPQVFELFAQLDRSHSRSQSGLGIGLSLARTLAELHGGTLTAASDGLGHGARFTLRLPLAAPPSAVAASAKPALATRATRVLLVDDNRDAADTTAELLRMSGAEVVVTHDGASALQRIVGLQPDVVVLDIGMPEMDGHEVARRIRAMADAVGRPRLIALTGWGQQRDRDNTRAAGFDEHLVKPVDIEVLERAVFGDAERA